MHRHVIEADYYVGGARFPPSTEGNYYILGLGVIHGDTRSLDYSLCGLGCWFQRVGFLGLRV